MNTIITAPEYKIQIDTEKILSELNNGSIGQMRALPEFQQEETVIQSHGMDSIPLEIFNQLVEHRISSGNLRDAMLLVCMANWGMRFSDVIRVRFCHIFNNNGEILKKFRIPSGEQKTSKENIYYNNRATESIIKLYLRKNPDTTRLDYMFVNNSNNCKSRTLLDVETEEHFGKTISNLTKKEKDINKQLESLIKLYAENLINAEEFTQSKIRLQAEKEAVQIKLNDINGKIDRFKAENPGKISYRIREAITRTTLEKIIKKTLAEIGIFPQNKLDKSHDVTIEEKYNTHSLRKSFSEYFYLTGVNLKDKGVVVLDNDMLQLLQTKFMHSSMNITNRYNKAMLNAFETICSEMNLGMEAIVKAIGGKYAET